MRKAFGISCMIVGAVLILSALLLFFYNRSIDKSAGKESEAMLEDVLQYIASKNENTGKIETDSGDNAADTPEEPQEMPVAEITGNRYIGYLSIPALGIKLPILAEWDGDYSKLNIAPCRHFGSTVTDDLVIAGHNYTSHFAYLSNLTKGHSIIFTDMDGKTYTYVIDRFEVVAPDRVDYIKNSGYGLVLYTCTYSGSTRFTVFANRVEDGADPISDTTKPTE